MSYFESVKAKQVITLLAIIVLFVFLFFSLIDFIPSFLGALVLYIIFSPMMHYLTVKHKLNKSWAVLIIILISIVVVLVPTITFTNMLVVKLKHILSGNTLIKMQLEHVNVLAKQYFNINIMSEENISLIQKKAAEIIPRIFNQTLGAVLDLAIMYFILFYMLFSWDNITDIVVRYLPYKKENAELFANELKSQTFSNVVGAPFLALIQGIIAIFGFWIFGLHEPVFWGMMCGFLSFVPFVGTTLVWLPAGIVQLSMGEQWQGVGILLYGAFLITYIDNIVRFIFQKKMADVHPMITVFGVIFGLERFGVVGIIFGPLLISFFLLMIKTYRIEYGDKSILNN